MKIFMQALLAINLSMAAPHQLLATEQVGPDSGTATVPDVAMPPPPPGPYRSTTLSAAPPVSAAMPPPPAWMGRDGYRHLQHRQPNAMAPPPVSGSMPPPAWGLDPRQGNYQQPAWQPLPPPGGYMGRQQGLSAPAYDTQAPVNEREQAWTFPPPETWMPLDDRSGYGYNDRRGYDERRPYNAWPGYQNTDNRGGYGGDYGDPYGPPSAYYPPQQAYPAYPPPQTPPAYTPPPPPPPAPTSPAR